MNLYLQKESIFVHSHVDKSIKHLKNIHLEELSVISNESTMDNHAIPHD